MFDVLRMNLEPIVKLIRYFVQGLKGEEAAIFLSPILLFLLLLFTFSPVQSTYLGVNAATDYLLINDLQEQQAKLTASDAMYGDYFGLSVAVDGDTVVVGADTNDNGLRSGSAYVFVRNGSSWSQQAKLTASDPAAGDAFGKSVAIDGDTILIGAFCNNNCRGAAYVFVRSGSNWSQQAKLVAEDAASNDFFGGSVSLDDDTVIIGAEQDADNGPNSGSAYVFIRSGTSWSQQAKLTASDAKKFDNFGSSVAIDNDTVLVGAPNDDDNGNSSGSAYVFVRNGSSWSQQSKLTASDGAEDDRLGWTLAASGDTAVIGATFDDDDGENSGSAYVFVRSGTDWSQQEKLTANDAAAEDTFGRSVAIDGDTVVIGADAFGGGSTKTGYAYVFVRSDASWSQLQKLTSDDGAENDGFGRSVTLSGDTAVIGAPYDDDSVFDSGSAYVFSTTYLSVNDFSQTEGDSGISNFIFTVMRTNNNGNITVDYATADGTATIADGDYVMDSGTLNFVAGGSLTQQISVQINGDVEVEPNETFVINISSTSGDALIIDNQGLGIIQDDDTSYIFLPMIINE